ncbi:TorF family putative porin [Acinetobacter sp. ANC 3882]|uniref:TorF family putative porin n=1 Tax=Acinetobacter sp. ANC 3882 TaxID=2923423 RepID=UPI001F4A3331|nr:TorF family putative porin [Acinetobacter sp. ANC 3882]MCH7315284.1 TorF family putative porin [Acinetobacter sp. ANC 3882]
MKKLLLIAPLAFYFQSTHATETTSPYSANVTAASQYVSRGFQQTWGKPALQGGMDYNHSSGFYAGTWASTVSDHFIRDASVEWDVYTGYSRSFGDWTVGTKVAYYFYPGAKTTADTDNTRFDYGEIIPEISYGPLSVKYAITYTQDYFGNNADTLGTGNNKHSRGSGYLDVNWLQPITQGWSVNAHYGNQRIKNFSAASFQDASFSVNKELPYNLSSSLTYSKAWDKDGFYQQYSNGNPNAKVSNPIDSTLTFSLTKTF